MFPRRAHVGLDHAESGSPSAPDPRPPVPHESVAAGAPIAAQTLGKAQLSEDDVFLCRQVAVAISRDVYRLDENDAEDVVQDTLLAVLQRRGAIHSVADYSAQVARNTCRKLLRRNIVTRKRDCGVDHADAVAGAEDPGARCLSIGRFFEAVCQLSKRCRQLIHALFVRAATHREAAQLLGVSPGSVQRNKDACLADLRRRFSRVPGKRA